MDHKEIKFGSQQTRMAPTKNISSILSSLTSVLVEGGVDEETVRRLTPDLTTWVESFASRLEKKFYYIFLFFLTPDLTTWVESFASRLEVDKTKVDEQTQMRGDELTLK